MAGKGIPAKIISVIAVTAVSACGETTITGTQRNIDVGSSRDASAGSGGNGRGGAVGTGGRNGSGATIEAGGTAGTGGADSGGASPQCCRRDFDCGDLYYVPCVSGVCKYPMSGQCWTNAECPNGGPCVGAFVCGCGLLCDQGDMPGRCQSPIADAGDAAVKSDASGDSPQSTCLPPPNLPPTSPTCPDLPYNAASQSYVIWIADPSAPGGGYSISLATNQAATVGGHTYKNTGAGLVGGGVHGVYGDAGFDVDGVANALSFHFEGCATPVAADSWELVAAVTRSGPSCTSCPESITRRYSIRRTGSVSTERYTFDADGRPQGCSLGADLLEIVLY